MTIIEVRPYRNGWEVYENAGVQPVFLNQQDAIGYAMHSSRSDDAVIRVYDHSGNVIETHEHKGDFKEW